MRDDKAEPLIIEQGYRKRKFVFTVEVLITIQSNQITCNR